MEAGTRLQFRSPAHAIDVTADEHGHAVLPALFTLENEQVPDDAVVPELESFARRLPDVETVTAVPGFADEPVAVATLRSGEKLMLNVGADGPRVVGPSAGPIGSVAVADDRAVTRSHDRVSAFSVLRSDDLRPRRR